MLFKQCKNVTAFREIVSPPSAHSFVLGFPSILVFQILKIKGTHALRINR
jgi:hypothetical protein